LRRASRNLVPFRRKVRGEERGARCDVRSDERKGASKASVGRGCKLCMKACNAFAIASLQPPAPCSPCALPTAIPIILQNRNVLARAKNGTGKTAAYIIPCLEKTDTSKNEIQVLMLIPTRELALQTSAIVKEVGKHMGLECMVTTGGTSLKDDIMRLYNPVHIIVATPGRILDLASKDVAKLGNCKTIIMDEADKLLSPEFQPVLEQVRAASVVQRA